MVFVVVLVRFLLAARIARTLVPTLIAARSMVGGLYVSPS
jgi:hypothetical protein